MTDHRTRRELLTATATASTVAATGCLHALPGGGSAGSIEVPNRSAVGSPLDVRLSGFEPNSSIELEATATDARDVIYTTAWSLRTDGQGTATLADAGTESDPLASTWYGSERGRRLGRSAAVSMLLGRLRPTDESPTPPNFLVGDRTSIDVTFDARSGLLGRSAARTSATRVYIDPGLSRRSVEANGLVGRLYTPPTPGPHPGVIALHGSEAFVLDELSRLLATHGYATLALQYFDAPGLPDSVNEIPVEYFGRAIRWLTNLEEVSREKIGLVGFSRGVEAALLAGVAHDGPATVVGYSGGGVPVWGAEGIPPERFVERAAWTRDGTPVAPAEAIGSVFDAARDGTSRYRCAADSVTKAIRSRVSEHVLERALIPVEAIDGSVFLLAGADDRQWPSAPLAALAIERLQRQDHSHPHGLRTYCEAGHLFLYPYRDYTGSPTSADNGGTPIANARAAADAWPLVLASLDHGLRSR